MFGLQGNLLMNHIILLAKKHIYYRRLKNLEPNIQYFVAYVKSVRECEFYISKVKMTYENTSQNGHRSKGKCN